MTIVNKNYSRENSSKMKASYKTKARDGWWPYRHTPLGYVHSKERDGFGNAIKGTAKLVADPNPKKVALVQREFQLRASGYSYEAIKKQTLTEGLVPLELSKTYSHHAVEDRLKNPLYWGYFFLTGDPTRYEGKHSLIIDQSILREVRSVNEGRVRGKTKLMHNDDIFRGWLYCDHPECKRLITYEKKEKVLKSTGESKVYHLYRCSNSRRIHLKKVYVGEEKLWEQFSPVVEALEICPDFARDITEALNETHQKQKQAIRKQMDGFRDLRDGIRSQRKNATKLFTGGKLRERDYSEQIEDLDKQEDHFTDELERLALSISDEAMTSVHKVFELAINAKSLWKSMERENKLEYLKQVCSNPTLDGLTLRYQLQSPFARLASWKENKEWRRERDSNS